MIGRVDRQKGVLHFIRAAAEVNRRRSGLRFIIIGEGPWMARAQAQARRLRLTHILEFTGWIPARRQAFERIDLLVVPSLWEGMPYVVLEAMALRKPIIASCVNGLPEMITHEETGLLVPPAAPSALAEAMLSLASHPAKAQDMAERAYTTVFPRFDAQVMTKRTMTVYHTVLTRHANAQ
jgi:glycosyltransferase involved in cell wall biosynthesis